MRTQVSQHFAAIDRETYLIHHRAQLGVYLRLNDVAIPGMYGPSADEMKFWEPAAAQTAGTN